MVIPLVRSTAGQELALGPFVDATDGFTAETGLTIANTDIKLWKSGATTLANKNSGGATHISGGIYYIVLDATDTNTYGPMAIFIHVAGARPITVYCDVQISTVYDDRYTGQGLSDLASASSAISNLSSSVSALTNFLLLDWDTIATAADESHIELWASGHNYPVFEGCMIGVKDVSSGTFYYTFRWITAYDGATRIATLHEALPFLPEDGVDTFVIYASRGDLMEAAGGGSAPTAVENAEAVWALNLTSEGYTGAGSGAGDWLVDADNKVIALHTRVGTPSDLGSGATVAANLVDIEGQTDNLPGIETKIDTIDDFLDTEVAAIKTKTDGLPADPADASDIAALFVTVNSKLDAIDDYVDSEVAAIKAKTDLIPASPAAVGDIPTAIQNADALLNRDMSLGTDSGSTTVRTPRQALRAARNRVAISGGTATVYKEDDATASWTAAVTTAAGNPITEINPAGP